MIELISPRSTFRYFYSEGFWRSKVKFVYCCQRIGTSGIVFTNEWYIYIIRIWLRTIKNPFEKYVFLIAADANSIITTKSYRSPSTFCLCLRMSCDEVRGLVFMRIACIFRIIIFFLFSPHIFIVLEKKFTSKARNFKLFYFSEKKKDANWIINYVENVIRCILMSTVWTKNILCYCTFSRTS